MMCAMNEIEFKLSIVRICKNVLAFIRQDLYASYRQCHQCTTNSNR